MLDTPAPSKRAKRPKALSDAERAERKRQQDRERHRANRATRNAVAERKRAYNQQWDNAHPDVRREYKHRRRARKRGNGGSITRAAMSALRAKIGHACANCGTTVKATKKPMTIDHIISIAKGGAHVLSNIQFLCHPCNSAKRDLDPIDFARRQGRLC